MGRELFARVISAEGGLAAEIRKLKGRELDALINYAEGHPAEDGIREEIIGTALLEAAGRYLKKARAKADKKARRAKRIL